MLFGKWNCKSCQRYTILLIQWKGCWITYPSKCKAIDKQGSGRSRQLTKKRKSARIMRRHFRMEWFEYYKLISWENGKTFGFLSFSFHFKYIVCLSIPPHPRHESSLWSWDQIWQITIFCYPTVCQKILCAPLKKVYPFFLSF